MSSPSLEDIFENLFGHQNYIPFVGKKFLEGKINYYSKENIQRADLYLDKFIYENYDAFKEYCDRKNKKIQFEDLEFKVKDIL